MYHIFEVNGSVVNYNGITENPLAGSNEKLLGEGLYDPNTQIFSLVNDEIVVADNAEKQVAHNKQLHLQALSAVDMETKGEIENGFVFDGHRFSLSQSAQLNWQGMLLLHQSDLFENQEISTKDDGSYLLIKSKLIEFIKAGSVVIKNTLKIGRDKKKQL